VESSRRLLGGDIELLMGLGNLGWVGLGLGPGGTVVAIRWPSIYSPRGHCSVPTRIAFSKTKPKKNEVGRRLPAGPGRLVTVWSAVERAAASKTSG
jgi:hypothetical protein